MTNIGKLITVLLAVVFLGQGSVARSILYTVHLNQEGYPPLDTPFPAVSTVAHEHEDCAICKTMTAVSDASESTYSESYSVLSLEEYVYADPDIVSDSAVSSRFMARAPPRFPSFSSKMKGIGDETEKARGYNSAASLYSVRRCGCF